MKINQGGTSDQTEKKADGLCSGVHIKRGIKVDELVKKLIKYKASLCFRLLINDLVA